MSIPFHPRPSRQKRQRIMRAVLDAGGKRLESGPIRRLIDVVFKCPQCGFSAVKAGTLNTTEIARGIPCPKCNRN